MRSGEAHDFRKPRARYEDARRRDPAFLERFERRAIHGVRHAEVVGMDDEQPRVCRIPEPLLDGAPVRLRIAKARQQDSYARNTDERDRLPHGSSANQSVSLRKSLRAAAAAAAHAPPSSPRADCPTT